MSGCETPLSTTAVLKHQRTRPCWGFRPPPCTSHPPTSPNTLPPITPSYPASGKGCPGLSWSGSEGRCCCCRQESWGSCCWGSGGMGGCWVAGRSLGTWRSAACEAHFVPGFGTEPEGCAEGCTRCAVEPARAGELETESKERQMRTAKTRNDFTHSK